MKKSNDVSLKDALQQFLETYHIKQKFDQTSVPAIWADVVGKPIANRTEKIYVSNHKLFIKTESSVVKHEINLMKESIIRRINERVGSEIVVEIVLL